MVTSTERIAKECPPNLSRSVENFLHISYNHHLMNPTTGSTDRPEILMNDWSGIQCIIDTFVDVVHEASKTTLTLVVILDSKITLGKKTTFDFILLTVIHHSQMTELQICSHEVAVLLLRTFFLR